MSPSAADLAPVYALVARVFLKEVDAELVRELGRPELVDVFESLEPGFAGHLTGRTWGEAELEVEATEFARLFLMPKGVSPYASSWASGEEGAVRAGLQEKISNLYEVLRVRPMDFGLGNVPADHIGMLLSLTTVALKTDASGDLAEESATLYISWSPRFAEAVIDTSTSPIYRATARLLLDLLGRDAPPP